MSETERVSPEPGVHARDAAIISGLGKTTSKICAVLSGVTTGLTMFGNIINDNPVFEHTAEPIVLTIVTTAASVGFAGLQRYYQNRADMIKNIQ